MDGTLSCISPQNLNDFRSLVKHDRVYSKCFYIFKIKNISAATQHKYFI